MIQKKLGLSLSGGGYRAAAFHLGTLKALDKLGLLIKVKVMSTISGGSIIGAYYCLNPGNFAGFEKATYESLQKSNIIKKILFSSLILGPLLLTILFLGPAFYFLFTPLAWLFPILLALFLIIIFKFQFYIFPVSRAIEKAYDEFFYKNKKLSDLPAQPELVIGATNIQTSRPFIFARDRMEDSSYKFSNPAILFDPLNFPLSRAVMASSCVPFAFTPVKIAREFFKDPSQAQQVHPVLVDGGVYDNQGIHKLTQKGHYECSHIIVSDAGGGAQGELNFNNAITLLITTVDVFMARIKKAQMVKDIYENTASANKEIAFFSLAWDIEECIPGFIRNLADGNITASVIAAHQLLPQWVNDPAGNATVITSWLERQTGYGAILAAAPDHAERELARKVGTNLTSLGKKAVDALIKQAACLTELQVKLYCPTA